MYLGPQQITHRKGCCRESPDKEKNIGPIRPSRSLGLGSSGGRGNSYRKTDQILYVSKRGRVFRISKCYCGCFPQRVSVGMLWHELFAACNIVCINHFVTLHFTAHLSYIKLILFLSADFKVLVNINLDTFAWELILLSPILIVLYNYIHANGNHSFHMVPGFTYLLQYPCLTVMKQ